MSVDVLGRPRIAIVPRTEPLPMRVQPRLCLCGGLIDPGYETEIPAAVARHQAERRHLAWRERRGF